MSIEQSSGQGPSLWLACSKLDGHAADQNCRTLLTVCSAPTRRYSSYTSLKKLFTRSSLRPSCSSKNLTCAAVVKADTWACIRGGAPSGMGRVAAQSECGSGAGWSGAKAPYPARFVLPTCRLLKRSTTPRCIELECHSASSTASSAACSTKWYRYCGRSCTEVMPGKGRAERSGLTSSQSGLVRVHTAVTRRVRTSRPPASVDLALRSASYSGTSSAPTITICSTDMGATPAPL